MADTDVEVHSNGTEKHLGPKENGLSDELDSNDSTMCNGKMENGENGAEVTSGKAAVKVDMAGGIEDKADDNGSSGRISPGAEDMDCTEADEKSPAPVNGNHIEGASDSDTMHSVQSVPEQSDPVSVPKSESSKSSSAKSEHSENSNGPSIELSDDSNNAMDVDLDKSTDKKQTVTEDEFGVTEDASKGDDGDDDNVTVVEILVDDNGKTVVARRNSSDSISIEHESKNRNSPSLNEKDAVDKCDSKSSDIQSAAQVSTQNDGSSESKPTSNQKNDADEKVQTRGAAKQKPNQDSTKKAHSRSKEQEVDNGSDGLRPLAKILFDVGLDLARKQVYGDLIRIQNKKSNQKTLSDKEEVQLEKLKEAQEHLIEKNGPFILNSKKCDCGFATSLDNVMESHKDYGHEHRDGRISCAMCCHVSVFAGQHFFHMRSEHNRSGRVYPKMASIVCPFCPFEGNNKKTADRHIEKCSKNFRLQRNLQPTPADCDIPLKGLPLKPPPPQKPQQPALAPRPQQSVGALLGQNDPRRPLAPQRPQLRPVQVPNLARPGVQAAAARPQGQPQNQVVQMGDQLYTVVYHSGQAFLTPLTAALQAGMVQSAGGSPKVTTIPQLQTAKPKQATPSPKDNNKDLEICEICGGFVKDRESLRIHFYWAHKIEIHPAVIKDKSRSLKCDTCRQQFWTYQGLMKHAQVVHQQSRLTTTATTCYVCALTNVPDFITHMTLKHPMVVKALLGQNRCIVCQMAHADEDALEQHIITEHKLVVNHYSAVENMMTLGDKKKSPTPPPNKTPNKKEKTPRKEKFYCRCGKVSTNQDEHTQHRIDAHMYKCSRCKDVFEEKDEINKHWHSTHSKEKDPCELCNVKIAIGRPYVRHMKGEHLKQFSVVLTKLPKAKFDVLYEELQEWKAVKEEQEKQEKEEEIRKKEESSKRKRDEVDDDGDDVMVIDLDSPATKRPRPAPASKRREMLERQLRREKAAAAKKEAEAASKQDDDVMDITEDVAEEAASGEDSKEATAEGQDGEETKNEENKDDSDTPLKEVLEIDGETIVIQQMDD